MIFEIIFNIIAVVMFITMFFKMIKKNNTQYLYILLMQFIGILINFIELIFIECTNVTLKLIAFILSIIGIFVAPYLMKYDVNLVKPYIIWLNVATVSECYYLHNYIIPPC